MPICTCNKKCQLGLASNAALCSKTTYPLLLAAAQDILPFFPSVKATLSRRQIA